MPDLRERRLRWVLAAVVVVIALLDVQTLVQTLRSQGRMRERIAHITQAAISASRQRLQQRFDMEGGPSRSAARELLATTLCQELEVFDTGGRALFAEPIAAPVSHWLDEETRRRVLAGEVATLGPLFGGAPRLLTYVSASASGGPVIVRFARAVPELASDLEERRQLILGHALSLVLLVSIAALALFPTRESEPRASGSALDAYVQAMEKLRDRGAALEQQIQDTAPFVRAGELTAGMAHEVRNGLGTIVGYARLVERGTTPEEAIQAARAIREEGEALEAIVRRFVELVRPDELRLASFDVGRMLSRVAAREEHLRPGTAIDVDGRPLEVVADEEVLERAVENLVRNAREAAGASGRVVVKARSDGAAVAITVEDDGPGLTAEQRAALRPFFSTKPGGLGLGLAIVHKVASLHGGQLLIGDSATGGLAATLRLPFEASGATERSSPAVVAEPGERDQARFQVVENKID